MKTTRKIKITALPLFTTAILFTTSVLAGCSGTIAGGYHHDDMSRSHFREQILKKADQLAQSPNAKDKKVAAELYGSIKELELMDKCIDEYFQQKPQSGLYLMMTGEKIHKFYKD